MTSLCLMPFGKLDHEDYEAQAKDSWQMAVLCLVLDCLFTIARLCLDIGVLSHLKDCIQNVRDLQGNAFRGDDNTLFPRDLRVLLVHYIGWLGILEPVRLTDNAVLLGKAILEQARASVPVDDQDVIWRYLNEDCEFLNRVVAGEAKLMSDDFGRFKSPYVNFQRLLGRPLVYNTTMHPRSPREKVRGWTTKREFPKPEVAARMIEFSDDSPKLKFKERAAFWSEVAHDHGHITFAVLNLPREPGEEQAEEEEEAPGMLPGWPPGMLPLDVLAGAIGIQIGPVGTLGGLLGNMGMPGGVPPP